MLFLAGLGIVGVVAALTFGVALALGLDDDDVAGDDPTLDGDAPSGTTPPVEAEAPLAEDQVAVTGFANGITVEGGTIERIDTPFVVEGGGGRGATITDVEVDGQLTDVVWDGGRDFDLQAGGLGVEPSQVNLFAAPTSITIGFPDEMAHSFVPGVYGLRTPAAIGRGGLADAQDAVAFAATVESALAFRGGATTSMLPRRLTIEAAGRVLVQGDLEVRRHDGVTVRAAGVELPEGQYRVTFTPRADGTGYDVDALLQGDVTVS